MDKSYITVDSNIYAKVKGIPSSFNGAERHTLSNALHMAIISRGSWLFAIY